MKTRAAVTGLFLCLTVLPASAAEPALDRAVDAANASPIIPDDIIERAKAGCETALCFARRLAARLPDRVRLEPVDHPDSDSIRWARTTPSVIVDKTPGTPRLNITQFGRKAAAELREALTGAGRRLLVDLRGNPGGDFERMLEMAGLLLGPLRDVVEIDHGDRIERRSLSGPDVRSWQVVSVETDGKTASAALLLARLIRTYAGAEPAGQAAADQPVFLKRRIPIDHDWRLILPVATLRVAAPG